MATDQNLIRALATVLATRSPQVPQVGDDDEWVPPPPRRYRRAAPPTPDPVGVDPVGTIYVPQSQDLWDLGKHGGDLKGLTREGRHPAGFLRKIGPGSEGWNARLPSRLPLEWTHDGQTILYDDHRNPSRIPFEATPTAQYGLEGPIGPHYGPVRDLEELMGIRRRTGRFRRGPIGSGWHEYGYLAGPEDEYQRRKYNDEGIARVRESLRSRGVKLPRYDLLDKLNRESSTDSDINLMEKRKWQYGGKDVHVEWVNGRPVVISVEGGRVDPATVRDIPPEPRIPRGLETLF